MSAKEATASTLRNLGVERTKKWMAARSCRMGLPGLRPDQNRIGHCGFQNRPLKVETVRATHVQGARNAA